MDSRYPRYSDGEAVRVGDRVAGPGAVRGEIDFVIERGEFAADFPAAERAYLSCGLMVRESDGPAPLGCWPVARSS